MLPRTASKHKKTMNRSGHKNDQIVVVFRVHTRLEAGRTGRGREESRIDA